MQAKVNCKIESVYCDKDEVTLTLSSVSGKVDVKMPPAQSIEFDGHIRVKPVVGNQIKIGSIIVLDITVIEGEQK